MVLPTNGKEIILTLDKLQEVPSTLSDPSYVPQDDLEPHLIQQSKLNDLHDINLSKQQAELQALGLQQCNLLAKETRIPYSGRGMRNFPDSTECMIQNAG
jgi:hypothetical protein